MSFMLSVESWPRSAFHSAGYMTGLGSFSISHLPVESYELLGDEPDVVAPPTEVSSL